MAHGAVERNRETRLELPSRRIDKAHHTRREDHRESPDADSLPLPCPDAESQALAPDIESPVEMHLTELAERLQQRQAELDRRESQLHAERAELESQCRAARLWIEERHAEIQDQQQTLQQQSEAHHARDAALCDRERELTNLAARLEQERKATQADAQRRGHLDGELSARAKMLAHTEEELDRKRAGLETLADELELERALLLRRDEELNATAAEWEARQRELDQRQAALYRDLEGLTEERTAVVRKQQFLAERQGTLEQREAACAARAQELEACARELADQVSELELERAEAVQRQAALDEQALQLELREQQLEYRRREIGLALERYERLGITEQKLIEIRSQEAALRERREHLDRAGRLVEEQQNDLQRLRDSIESERHAERRRLETERQASAKCRLDAERSLRERQEQLDRREKQIARREESLNTLQAELHARQQDTLEMRLAAEELWAQLAGSLAPASLERSLAQLRSRLADQYRLAEERLAERHCELVELREELTRMQERIAERQFAVEQWLQQTSRQMDERTDRLEAREQDLDRQEAFFTERESAWHQERSCLANELRRALGKLADELPAAA